MTTATKTHCLSEHRAEKKQSNIGFHTYVILPFILQSLLWLLVRPFLHIFGDIRIVGAKEVGRVKGPVLFVANHPNQIDPAIARAALPLFSRHSPFFYVSRDKQTYSWDGWRKYIFTDTFFLALGAPIAPAGLKNYAMTLKEHVQIMKDGHSFCMFPKGGQERFNGKFAPARGGVAYLAHATGVPIIPVNILGTERFTLKRFFEGKHKLGIIYGTPINPGEFFEEKKESYTADEYKEAAEKMMNHVYSLEFEK